jgi:hypothetical protein
VAVTSTDMHDPEHRGRFLAAPQGAHNCEAGTPAGLALEACDALAERGLLTPIIDSRTLATTCEGELDPGACRADLLRLHFGCLASLGTGGFGFEAGLDALRSALSCEGPNADQFRACCTESGYDPACAPDPHEAPTFLRPGATLAVVIVSDEDDCSVAPGASIDVENLHACAWQRDSLNPVGDYVRFLNGLKAQPAEQILVAAVVGRRLYTESGHAVTFDAGPGDTRCQPGHPDYDARVPLDACCPDGRCAGPVLLSCSSDNGNAMAGTRYLELAEAFGARGVGCPSGAEGGAGCVDICTDDFAEPLRVVGERVREMVGGFCLDRTPACRVDGRSCATPEERATSVNYALRVELACPVDSECVGQPVRALEASDWSIQLDGDRCAGRPRLNLVELPPPGSEVVLDFQISLD